MLSKINRQKRRRRERINVTVKLCLTLLAGLVLLTSTYPVLHGYFEQGNPSDDGERPLVIVTLPPGNDPVAFVGRWQTQGDSDLKLFYFLASTRPTDPNQEKLVVSVTFIYPSASVDTVNCGTNGRTEVSKVLYANNGIKYAARADAEEIGSILTGALNPTGSVSSNSLNDTALVTHTQSLKPRKWDSKSQTDFDTSGGESVVCTIPRTAVWHDSGLSSSALIPEVDR